MTSHPDKNAPTFQGETMNAIIDNICSRRSIRKYKPDMLPKETIEEIIRAGTYAASGMGTQGSIIVAATNKELRDRLSRMNLKAGNEVYNYGWKEGFDPFYGAPVVLTVLADRSNFTYVYDGSLVMGNLMLAASSLRVGSCWIHRAKEVFDTPEGKEILASLGIRGDYEGIGFCILGYPEGSQPRAPRRKENRVFFAE